MNCADFPRPDSCRQILLLALSVVLATPAVWADQQVFVPSKDNTLFEHPSANLSNGAGTALFFGAVLSTTGQKGKQVIEVFSGLNEAIMGMVHVLMKAAPVHVKLERCIILIARSPLTTKDPVPIMQWV